MNDPSYELFDASRGGFAKVDPLLLEFIEQTEQASGIPLEPLYTGKALLALRQQVEAGKFARGTRLIFIHTGGLQGRRGFSSTNLIMRQLQVLLFTRLGIIRSKVLSPTT